MPKIGHYNNTILDVHAKATARDTISARIDRKVFNYFFRQVLPGERGPRQALTCFFFQKFYEACLADGIEPFWDEENEARVNAVLQRLNFNETKDKKGPRK